MKNWILIISIMFVAGISFAANTTDSDVEGPNAPKKEINVPHALLRGTVNLGTFWLEVPREIVVESNHNPVYGVVVGTAKGLYYAGARLVYSVLDFALLGFTGPSGYSSKFPEYVWEEQWNPWPEAAHSTAD